MKRNRITLNFDTRPKAKQSGRIGKKINGKSFMYADDKVKIYETNILIEALSQRPNGFKKLCGPLFAKVVYRFPIPKSFSKETKQLINEGRKVYKITVPDLTDNINKGLFDALAGSFYKNDCQVAKFIAEKVFSENPGITLIMKELY